MVNQTLNLDSRIKTENHVLVLGDERFSFAFFGDAIITINLLKNRIVVYVDGAKIQEHLLYNPTMNLYLNIKEQLGAIPKGLEITYRFV